MNKVNGTSSMCGHVRRAVDNLPFQWKDPVRQKFSSRIEKMAPVTWHTEYQNQVRRKKVTFTRINFIFMQPQA